MVSRFKLLSSIDYRFSANARFPQAISVYEHAIVNHIQDNARDSCFDSTIVGMSMVNFRVMLVGMYEKGMMVQMSVWFPRRGCSCGRLQS